MLARIARAQQDRAAAVRMQQGRADAVAVGIGRSDLRKPQARVGGRAAKHELDVGNHQLGARLDEGVQTARHHGTRTGAEEIGADHADRHPIEAHLLSEGAVGQPLEKDAHRQVILQVRPDRQIDHRFDADLGEMRRRADARQHEELRRVECTARQDDLTIRLDRHRVAASVDELDAGGTCAPHQDAGGKDTGTDREIGAPARRLEIGGCGGGAIAVANGVLAASEAFLPHSIVVIGHGQARGRGRLEPGVVERIAGLGELGADRPRIAAPPILSALPGFATFEVGKHVGVGPAARTFLRPAVVVAAMAAGICHHVDRRRSAQHLAAHRLDPSPVQVRLGLGVVAPVEHVVFVHLGHAERDVDERIEVAPARFDQQHARRAILAQPIGQHAAGRAAPDDDVVVAFSRLHAVPSGHPGPVSRLTRPQTSSVLGANISPSSTRRTLSPCSWTYCAMVASTACAALKP